MTHQQSTFCGFLVCYKLSNTFAIILSKSLVINCTKKNKTVKNMPSLTFDI